MSAVDWVATGIAIVGTILLTTYVWTGLAWYWQLGLFFVLAGLAGGFLRIRRGE